MGIEKQSKVYHFRLFIPSQFQDDFCNKTLKFTLKTTHRREALKKVKVLTSLADTFLNQLQKTKLLQHQKKGHSMERQSLNKFIREYVRDGLEQFDQQQAHGRKGNSDTVDEELQAFDFISKNPVKALLLENSLLI